MNGRDLFTFSCWILLVDLVIRDLHNNSMDNIRLCSKSITKIVIEIMELSKRKIHWNAILPLVPGLLVAPELLAGLVVPEE